MRVVIILLVNIVFIPFAYSAENFGQLLSDAELAGVDGQAGISFDFKTDISIEHTAYKNNDGFVGAQDGYDLLPLFLKISNLNGTIEIGETTIDIGEAVNVFNNQDPVTADAIFIGLPKFIEFTDFKIKGLGITENFLDLVDPNPNITQGWYAMGVGLNGRFTNTGTIKVFAYNP